MKICNSDRRIRIRSNTTAAIVPAINHRLPRCQSPIMRVNGAFASELDIVTGESKLTPTSQSESPAAILIVHLISILFPVNSAVLLPFLYRYLLAMHDKL